MIVIDSNIFAKLFIDEDDSSIAESFFEYCLTHEVPLIAPDLFYYEVLQIALYYNHPVNLAVESIEDYMSFNLRLLPLNKERWLAVEKMVQSGHEKSGFPSLYDSCYHVLAMTNDCYFLRAYS